MIFLVQRICQKKNLCSQDVNFSSNTTNSPSVSKQYSDCAISDTIDDGGEISSNCTCTADVTSPLSTQDSSVNPCYENVHTHGSTDCVRNPSEIQAHCDQRSLLNDQTHNNSEDLQYNDRVKLDSTCEAENYPKKDCDDLFDH